MISIGSTDFYIDISTLSKEDLEIYATALFDDWEQYVDKTLNLPDYSLSINVEEGSIKAFGKIAIYSLSALYIGIGQYGSFISGLQTIKHQIDSTQNYFIKRAITPLDTDKQPVVKKRGEVLVQLQNLFQKVEQGKLSVDDAMARAEKILGTNIENSPEFMNDLENALRISSCIPEQIELFEHEINKAKPMLKQLNPSRNKPSKPKTPLPIEDHYRVEVWRDTKKGKKNVRIISL